MLEGRSQGSDCRRLRGAQEPSTGRQRMGQLGQAVCLRIFELANQSSQRANQPKLQIAAAWQPGGQGARRPGGQAASGPGGQWAGQAGLASRMPGTARSLARRESPGACWCEPRVLNMATSLHGLLACTACTAWSACTAFNACSACMAYTVCTACSACTASLPSCWPSDQRSHSAIRPPR